MTLLDAQASNNPNLARTDGRPPKLVNWAVRHVTLIAALLSLLGGVFTGINTLKEHGEKIENIENRVDGMDKKIDQIDRDTGYLSGRLDSRGQDRGR